MICTWKLQVLGEIWNHILIESPAGVCSKKYAHARMRARADFFYYIQKQKKLAENANVDTALEPNHTWKKKKLAFSASVCSKNSVHARESARVDFFSVRKKSATENFMLSVVWL